MMMPCFTLLLSIMKTKMEWELTHPIQVFATIYEMFSFKPIGDYFISVIVSAALSLM